MPSLPPCYFIRTQACLFLFWSSSLIHCEPLAPSSFLCFRDRVLLCSPGWPQPRFSCLTLLSAGIKIVNTLHALKTCFWRVFLCWQSGSVQNTAQPKKKSILFFEILFIIIVFLYWGYIVTFTKVLTLYHSWIHTLHHFLSYC
jgi:hypothetical protein